MLPESVYRVCDLLVILTNRNGVQWQLEVITTLVMQVGIELTTFAGY
jgi:hypothetical protein